MKVKNKARIIADISLIVMIIGFLVTLPFEEIKFAYILKSGFEAGLVGAIADLYAVTVLFRHPFGIKIPHTAILPKNREKIVNTLLDIVQNEWLKKETIIDKTKNIKFSKIILNKASEEFKKEENQEQLKEFLLKSYQKINKEKIEQYTLNKSKELIKDIPEKEVLNNLIDQIEKNNIQVKLYEKLILFADEKLKEEKTKEALYKLAIEAINSKSENKITSFLIKPMLALGEDKIKKTIDDIIKDTIVDLKEGKMKEKILLEINKEINNIKNSEKTEEILNSYKNNILNGEKIIEINKNINNKLINYIEINFVNDEFIKNKLFKYIETYIEKLNENEELKETIENKSKEAIANLIEKNHEKIGNLVKENLDKLTNEELVDMMENKIGKEMAWIRVNGAIFGFIMGIILGTISLIF